jgi:hypothetical protein
MLHVHTLLAARIGSELLSQGKVLNYKSAAGFQQGSKRPDDQCEKKRNHGPNLARHEMANNLDQYAFPRITGPEFVV